jgi:polysaccharide export outer membrane protein
MNAKSLSRLLLSAVATCGICLTGCAALQKTTASDTRPAASIAADMPYVIQPGDILQISVWKEKDLEREVLVRPDGGLSFPLVGDLQANGKTMDELRKDIEMRLTRFIPSPVVTVSAKQTLGHKIYVVGKVNRPGEYVATRFVDVMQALGMAGGLNPYAAANSIVILRRVNGVETSIPFKYGQVEDGHKLKQNIPLQSGDVVVVP